jgi:hypothetical protein
MNLVNTAVRWMGFMLCQLLSDAGNNKSPAPMLVGLSSAVVWANDDVRLSIFVT